MEAKYPFSDLHSFKDYVVFVQLCMPDDFPEREGVAADMQWSPELAFEGLRTGLDLGRMESSKNAIFDACRLLVDEAEQSYAKGDDAGGFHKLEEVVERLSTISTH